MALHMGVGCDLAPHKPPTALQQRGAATRSEQGERGGGGVDDVTRACDHLLAGKTKAYKLTKSLSHVAVAILSIYFSSRAP